MRVLLKEGAVSGEEFQREEAMAKNADAKVRQAQAKLQTVRSDIRAARSRQDRAQSMVQSAQAKLLKAQAELDRAAARVEQAEAEIAAAAGRVKMAEGDLEAARASARSMAAMAQASAGKIRQAQVGERSAAASLTTASVVQGYTEIRSTVDGVVTLRLISPGVLVNPGQALLKVAQIDPIRLQANVPETDLAKVRPGFPILARLQSGGSLSAKVTSITPAVDAAARTGVVEAVAPNPGARVKPGQYLRMEIAVGGGPSVLRVPTAAVRWQSAPSSAVLSTLQKPFVWVAEPAQEAARVLVSRRVEIRIGGSNGQFTEVLSGLAHGDQVVVRGHEDLTQGTRVAPVPWEDGPAVLPPPGTAAVGHTGHGAPAPRRSRTSKPPASEPHAGHGAHGGH